MVTTILDTELKAYFQENKQQFECNLIEEAVNVKDKINDILRVGDIDLINNAHRLVFYVLEGRETELQAFARQEGIAWATHSLAVSFKLEWVQAIRRTIWKFVREFNEGTPDILKGHFFNLEKRINTLIDQFLNSFFIDYSSYKDQLLTAQKELVQNLSVPVIPITSTISILPLIGAVDSFRNSILEEKVLTEVGRLRIQTLIMDLSGIADMESEVIDHLMKTIDGSSMMGCRTVITGLRADVVRKMLTLGIKFDKDTKTYGTLQQALNIYLINPDKQ
ncbi:STAS domain-containing protein [Paenisporosarcina quisquiliarum]|uniref:STAS domain-containing protein n=1 Tax=Paenisporosarcina quisquiliarum TaxID=365346 RepID=A0A9X3LJS2_9BACL|nr:STAS domain-containing protein [Paenisporosarcina quisquiliarum]MCZ8538311.1 STAS domain-containing protein [Paenisporosarcina quisquiliarum]